MDTMAPQIPRREYESTHPWISFKLDLNRFPYTLWALLGEAVSKCEHVAGTPLRPDIARELHQMFLAKGVLGTTAIEGNTLSEEEVLLHLEGELRLPPSREYLQREIENVISACNDIGAAIFEGRLEEISPELIMDYNGRVLDGLELEDDDAVPGQIRKRAVGVARYKAAPPADCEYLVERLCDWLTGPALTVVPQDQVVTYAVIRAIIAHLYVAWIHPFDDGNGRTARLLEFRILVASGVPTPTAHLLSNHYNQTRAGYYRQLDHASKSGGDVVPFVSYAVRGLVDGLREQLRLIQDQQLNEAWQNYVHDAFRESKSPGDQRRRHLVLDLSLQGEIVPKSQLLQLSPRVATAYAGKTGKTLTRDLNELVRMNLVERGPRGFRARSEIIRQFLPMKAPGGSL